MNTQTFERKVINSIKVPNNFQIVQETSVHYALYINQKIAAVCVSTLDFTDSDCLKWCDDNTGAPAKREVRLIIRNKDLKTQARVKRTYTSLELALQSMTNAFV